MRTATRILDIFELFSERGRPMTITQIAEELEAPVSSVFGLIKALTDRGYLHAVGGKRELYPTRRMLQNAMLISDHEPLVSQFFPFLEELRDETRETVILAQMNGRMTAAIYLSVMESDQTIRYSAKIGDFKPLHASAAGKSLLAAMPADRRKDMLAKLKMPCVTAHTMASRETLAADLERGLERGYQRTSGENIPDVGAIGMPISAYDQGFAIVIAGPTSRIRDNEEALAAKLRMCLSKVTHPL